MYDISFVGMGRVGLCTAVCFASRGYRTLVSTHDATKANLVNGGVPPFHEPLLEEMLQEATEKGYLKAVVGREEAVLQSDITFITIGTPSKTDGSIDLGFVRNAAREIGDALKKKDGHHLVVMKSTVVPGTTRHTVKPLLEKSSGKRCGIDFSLCSNPEFLREGSAIHDTLHPDFVVIGEHDEKSGDTLEKLYHQFYDDKPPPITRTNLSTAELTKYANNAFLATKVSFINTIANICERVPSADVEIVAETIGLDHRINPKFLNAGLGWGGSCFPKDVKALIAFSKQLGYDPDVLEAVWKVNEKQAKHAVEMAKKELGDLKNKRVAILGLSFKPETDDMREARSVLVVDELLNRGAVVVAYDPVAVPGARSIFEGRIEYAYSAVNCLKDADCCILVTEWNEFKKLQPKDFLQNMRQPILIDGRRIYNPKEFNQKLRYIGIGYGKP
jgi:UDPglucose 6-dehydrogenase